MDYAFCGESSSTPSLSTLLPSASQPDPGTACWLLLDTVTWVSTVLTLTKAHFGCHRWANSPKAGRNVDSERGLWGRLVGPGIFCQQGGSQRWCEPTALSMVSWGPAKESSQWHFPETEQKTRKSQPSFLIDAGRLEQLFHLLTSCPKKGLKRKEKESGLGGTSLWQDNFS